MMITPSVQVLQAGLDTEVTASDAVALRVPVGWSTDRLGAGRWRLGAPQPLRSGEIAVITAVFDGTDGVDRFAHARVLVHYTVGAHDLAAAPFLGCENEIGPVERNQSNGGGDPADGATMTVAGLTHPVGLGVSGRSRIRFLFGGGVDRISGSVGVDDESPDTEALVEVLLDDQVVLAETARFGQTPIDFDLPCPGVGVVEFRTRSIATSAAVPHIDWIAPRAHRHG